MPKGFDSCVKSGGRVRTAKPSAGKYMRVCYAKGKSHAGEVKTTRSSSSGKPQKTHSKK